MNGEKLEDCPRCNKSLDHFEYDRQYCYDCDETIHAMIEPYVKGE